MNNSASELGDQIALFWLKRYSYAYYPDDIGEQTYKFADNVLKARAISAGQLLYEEEQKRKLAFKVSRLIRKDIKPEQFRYLFYCTNQGHLPSLKDMIK